MKKIYVEELARIQSQINALFEKALLSSGVGPDEDSRPPGMWSPAVDILETDDAFVLHAELAGVRRDDIDLHVHEGELELSGARRTPGQGESFLRLERSYGDFRRVFRLGAAVDADRISARFSNGVLQVMVPKRGRSPVPVTEEG